MSLERVYTISLSKVYSIGRHTVRARRAVKHIKSFAKRHMKTSEEDIVFGQDLNEHIWRNGIQKPPRKIKVKMFKDDKGKVTLNLDAPIVKKEKKEKKVKKETKKKKTVKNPKKKNKKNNKTVKKEKEE
jgi:large subunit ribosomal protein L31e